MTSGSATGLPSPDPSRQETARRYARLRRRISVAELIFTGVLLVVLLATGLSRDIVARLGLPPVPAAAAYVFILMVVYGILTAPAGYYTGYVLPRRYGLSIQKLPGWLADQAKAAAIGLVLGAGAVAALYWFITDFPRLWWLLAWGLMILAGIVLAHLAPILIVPIFLKMRPLEDSALKARLEELARQAGVRVRGVFTLEVSRKGTTANAALMGTGRTRRIVLTDTLLKEYRPDEIEVILAHEMGHHRHGDIPAGMAIQASLMLVGFYLAGLIFPRAASALGYAGIEDVAAMPLLFAIIGGLGLLVSPLVNTYQRRRETAADDFALRLTGKPLAFVAMMTRLTDQNLAEAAPPRWVEVLLHDHPPYTARVEHARRYLSPGTGEVS